MSSYTDQVGRTIFIKELPQRIVSIVPSQTELLYDLGLDNEVTGITKFCVHPDSWFRSKTRIGGTKKLDIQKIRSLRPDLILANKEENNKEDIELLAKEFPVWVSDISNLGDALDMIRIVGLITGKKDIADEMAERINIRFRSACMGGAAVRTCYLIWKDPLMTVGGDTFIHDMLGRAGFENVFGGRERYPVTTIAEIQQAACSVVMLSSEPFPFGEAHLDEFRSLMPGQKIVLVDGELFSWYGSRLLKAADYFQVLRNEVMK